MPQEFDTDPPLQLNLSVVAYCDQPTEEAIGCTFEERGGSIGRGEDNDLVLPDTESVVSRIHALISYQNGEYLLTDQSTNGTFVNDSPIRLEPGEVYPIQDGDRLLFGNYLVVASLVSVDIAGGAESPLLSERTQAPLFPEMEAEGPPSPGTEAEEEQVLPETGEWQSDVQRPDWFPVGEEEPPGREEQSSPQERPPVPPLEQHMVPPWADQLGAEEPSAPDTAQEQPRGRSFGSGVPTGSIPGPAQSDQVSADGLITEDSPEPEDPFASAAPAVEEPKQRPMAAERREQVPEKIAANKQSYYSKYRNSSTLPPKLQEQLTVRAILKARKGSFRTVTGPAPQYYPPPMTDAGPPLEKSRDSWSSHQAPYPLLGIVIRYAALAGAIALAAWAGLKFLPLIIGTTTLSSKKRNKDEALDETSLVDCSVFAPPKLALGDVILVQVFLHPPTMAEEVQIGARQFDSAAEWRGFTSLSLDLADGARVAVQLDGGGLDVGDGCEEIRWNNRITGVSFLVKAPNDVKPSKKFLTVLLLVEGVPAGKIHFIMEVVASLQEEAPAEPLGDEAHRYRKAFISYASEDRTEVLKRVQTLGALKIDYFQDILDLEPGDRWEKELYKEIDKCDLFLLFWSSAARDSKWVHQEALYALQHQIDSKTDDPAIVPMMIEGPPPPKPWSDFSHLNFNDKLIYLMRPPGEV